MEPNQPSLPIRVRTATAADTAVIAEILLQAFSSYRPLYTPAGFDATVLDSIRVEERMGEGPVWVAEAEEAIVGTASAVMTLSGCHLRGMAVTPRARGRRIGWKLLEVVEAFAREHDAPRIDLSTTPFLDRAIRLYESFGFRRSDEGPHDHFGTPLFTMVKLLDSGVRRP